MNHDMPSDAPMTPERAISWRVHHVVEGGPLAWIVGLVIALVIPLTLVGIGEASLAFLVLVVFLYSLKEFWVPHTIDLSETTVRVTTPFSTREESWTRFRGCRRLPRGILLTRFKRPGLMDSFRGILLVVRREEIEKIYHFVENHLGTLPAGEIT